MKSEMGFFVGGCARGATDQAGLSCRAGELGTWEYVQPSTSPRRADETAHPERRADAYRTLGSGTRKPHSSLPKPRKSGNTSRPQLSATQQPDKSSQSHRSDAPASAPPRRPGVERASSHPHGHLKIRRRRDARGSPGRARLTLAPVKSASIACNIKMGRRLSGWLRPRGREVAERVCTKGRRRRVGRAIAELHL